jgi:hypothetical protein
MCIASGNLSEVLCQFLCQLVPSDLLPVLLYLHACRHMHESFPELVQNVAALSAEKAAKSVMKERERLAREALKVTANRARN